MLKSKIMRQRYFIFGILIIYFIFNLLIILRHEPWRDELQSWMIGRDSGNVLEVIYNSRYEGHPRLWYEIQFILSRFSHNFILMQLFHLCLATISVYLILKYAPFTKWIKILFIFSYFLTYEYSVLARNYALGILGLFLICAFHQQKKIFGKLLGIFLLCQSSIFGVIMALAYLFFNLFNLGKILAKKKTTKFFVPLLITSFIITNIVLAIWQIIPPVDSGFVVGWTTAYKPEHLQAVISIFWKALIPIPQAIFHFWNTNIFDNQPLLMAELGGGLIILSLLLFQHRSVCFLYLLGILGLLAFYYTKNIGYLRHQGQIFIWMFACLWLDRISVTFVVGWRKFLTNILLAGILSAQVYAAFYAVIMDWQYPFSGSKQAADFVRKNISHNYPLGADTDYTVSPIAAYLDKPLYYAVNQKWGTFLLWDQSRLSVDYDRTMHQSETMRIKTGRSVGLILSFVPDSKWSVKELFQVKQSIVEDEIYNIYLWF